MTQTLLTRGRAGLAAAALAALVAGGCGSSSSGNANGDPASLVPSSAPLYVSLVVRPDGDQKAQLEAVLRKVMRTNDPGAKIVNLFNSSTKKDGVTYDKDVKPWLGQKLGVFLSNLRGGGRSPDYGIVVAASDTKKGLTAVRKGDKSPRKRSYRGVDYEVNSKGMASAAIGDFVVGGTESGLKAIVDTSKDSGKAITKDDDFDKATSEAGRDGLASVYVNPGTLLDAAGASGSANATSITALRQVLSAAGVRAVGAGLDAQANGFTLTFATLGSKSNSVPGGDGPAALAAVPGDSWLGVGIGNLGGQVDNALKQIGQVGAFAGVNIDQILQQVQQQSGLDVRKDVIDWMGDAAIFVRGTSLGDVGGGLIVKSKDPAATARGIKRVARLLRRQGQTVTALSGVAGVDTGVSFRASNRIDVFLVAAGNRFIGAVGRSALDAALKSSQKLGDSPGFQSAASRLGDGLKPSFFFALQPVLQLVEGAGVANSPSYAKAKPYLQAFTTIVAGGKRSGDVGKGRVVVGVR